MNNLPKSILLISIKHSNKYSHLREICREFFKGMPHIEYTDYNLDSNNTYYILTATNIVNSFIVTVYDDINIPDILGYGIYDYTKCCSLILHTYMLSTYTYTYNPQCLPPSIKIDPNDVEKLESLKEN